MSESMNLRPYIITEKRLKEVSLHCRFLNNSNEEHTCDIIAASSEFILLEVGVKVTPNDGEKLMLYVDQLGRLEGNSNQIGEGVCLVQLKVSPRQQKRLSEKLENLNENDEIDSEIEKPIINNKLKRQDGSSHNCVVTGVSLWGMYVETSSQLYLDEKVTIGKMVGFVKRKDNKGARIAFRAGEHQNAMSRHFPRVSSLFTRNI